MVEEEISGASEFKGFEELLREASPEARHERSLVKVLGGLGQTTFDEVAESVVSRDYTETPEAAEVLAKRLGFKEEIGFGRTGFSLEQMEQKARGLRQERTPGAREQAETLEALLAIFAFNRDLPDNVGLTRKKLQEMRAEERRKK